MELLKCHRRLQDRLWRREQVNEKVCPGLPKLPRRQFEESFVRAAHLQVLVRTIVGTEGSMCTCGSP